MRKEGEPEDKTIIGWATCTCTIGCINGTTPVIHVHVVCMFSEEDIAT